MDYQRSNMYMRGPDHLVADDHGEYILGLIRDIWEVLDAIHNFRVFLCCSRPGKPLN